MLCPRCYGKHMAQIGGAWMPCPECAGIGELHCCDGLREQDECRAAEAPARVPSAFANPTREPMAANQSGAPTFA